MSISKQITIKAEDAKNFDLVMEHYRIPPDEIELCKEAYRRDPEANRIGFASLAFELKPAWEKIKLEKAA
ncbi:MAG: hypothetical protein ACKO0Z_22370 [Betaproteobacteria bacterium]